MLDPLAQNFGIDTSDEALLKAIEQHNEVCRLITEIGSYRKLDVPTITGYEFHVIQLASLTCPKDLILPYLRETAEELKTRQPDAKPAYRCKLVLSGAENDDPNFTKLIESCGARWTPSPGTISTSACVPGSWARTRCAAARSIWRTW